MKDIEIHVNPYNGNQSQDSWAITLPASLLRDLFAGMALQGMLASPPVVDRTRVDKAKWCGIAYEWADALMAEREKREGK